MSATERLRGLNINNINPHVKEAKYAVRGELAIKSEAYRAKLVKGDANLPFDKVISANIGNPQQLDQKPITFFRQVLSLVEYPPLLEHEDILLNQLGYKTDVIERAKWLLKQVGSVGAYSASAGAVGIRESVAKFIERMSPCISRVPVQWLTVCLGRDGHTADPANIYLCAGASSGVNTLLHVICASPKTGILVPIPQYPLYTASLSVLDSKCVPYYLDESKNWGTNLDAIKTACKKAQDEGTDVRAIVIINPGNPTGGSLPESDIKAIIEFAAQENLVIMADEVYQTNVFIGKFHSFRGILGNMQKENPGKFDTVELASLHSISKGMVGECGHRGGYFELVGFDKEVQEQIYKFVSISLCSPVVGQCLVEMMVNPPKEGEPSYELYKKEYDDIFQGLQERATALYEAFKEMEGVECQDPQVLPLSYHLPIRFP
jgi:alanine transaminase